MTPEEVQDLFVLLVEIQDMLRFILLSFFVLFGWSIMRKWTQRGVYSGK